MLFIKRAIKNIVRPLYYRMYYIYIVLFSKIFRSRIMDCKRIPIIINNRNRFTYLRKLIDSLESRGYYNIYILDNNSTYPPLLSYYSELSYKIIRLNANLGYLALWKSGLYKKFYRDYYVYTDPDVVLIEECPSDFLKVLHDKMRQDLSLYKVGLSLRIDDLPESYNKRNEVLHWEKQFYEERIDSFFFSARVDTTFALYRPGSTKAEANFYTKTYRSDFPYQVRHLPWYVDSNNLSEEDQFYIQNSATSTHWTG